MTEEDQAMVPPGVYNSTFPSNRTHYDLLNGTLPVVLFDGEGQNGGQARDEFYQHKVAMLLVRCVLPAVIFLGTIGNLLAVFVLFSKRMRNTSVNVYLGVLAIADTGVLYLSGFKTWLRVLSGWEMLHVSAAGCKIVMFLFLLCLHLSAWLVVAVGFDRAVAVWSPFTALTFCNVRRARITIIVLTLIMAIYNAHIFWTMQLVVTPRGQKCTPLEGYFMQTVYPWVKLTTYSCVPFVLVLIINICILMKILPDFNKQAINGDCRSTPRNLKDRRVTVMLIGVSVSWLALTGPFMLWTFIARPSQEPYHMACYFLAKTVCFLLMYINHGLNFYLYSLSGRKFRRALYDLFHPSRSNEVVRRATYRSSVSRSKPTRTETL